METIFQETWNIKKIEKNEFKTGDYSSFKITKIYFQKNLSCYFFGQRYPTKICAFKFKRYWLPSVLDFPDHSFFHCF